jgi:hypothetical protein
MSGERIATVAEIKRRLMVHAFASDGWHDLKRLTRTARTSRAERPEWPVVLDALRELLFEERIQYRQIGRGDEWAKR